MQLNEYELGSSLMPFEKWSVGEDLFGSLDKEHDIVDRDLRPFVEEADQMQAIQLMASVDDAWGGFAARYMDRLRDEYGKTAIWIWGLEDGIRGTPRVSNFPFHGLVVGLMVPDQHHEKPRTVPACGILTYFQDKQLLKLSNTARSISEISSQASLFIPMALPSNALPHYVRVDRKSPWHVSALLSTALESMTLPSRLKAQNGLRQSLDEIAGALNVNGNQNIAKLQMSICSESTSQFQMNRDDRPGRLEVRGHSSDPRVPSQNGLGGDLDILDESPAALDMNFFPLDDPNQARGRRVTKTIHIFGEAESFRGNEDLSGTNVDEEIGLDGRERARRRAEGLKVIHK